MYPPLVFSLQYLIIIIRPSNYFIGKNVCNCTGRTIIAQSHQWRGMGSRLRCTNSLTKDARQVLVE